jgi:hypothetical protein
MADKNISTENGTLYYTIKDDKVTITNYSGNDESLTIPSEIDGFMVRKIGKKAFMNTKRLKNIKLPEHVRKISDWAFAYCKMLKSISLPRRRINLGTDVFLDDIRLSEVNIYPRDNETGHKYDKMSDEEKAHLSLLLAAVPAMGDSKHLLDIKNAGSKEWYEQLDNRILKILDEPDDKGYTDMILCGEEDINCNLDTYIRDRRKRKVGYCFLRLMNDTHLKARVKKILYDYLISHSVGAPSMEAWLFLKDEAGQMKEYYEYYVELGCLNEDNFSSTIADLGDSSPEMKAYFLRWHEDKRDDKQDFFSGFTL